MDKAYTAIESTRMFPELHAPYFSALFADMVFTGIFRLQFSVGTSRNGAFVPEI